MPRLSPLRDDLPDSVEVSNAALASAIGGASCNRNGVGTLDTPFADPDAEALRGKLNELLVALRRA